ncbi:hypothetical protein K7432_013584 [Basidiobolus ranarum]|uniref:Chitin-binding type-1 domain-containing protein n=1 Tax=Basidiobolus ranarum TaxID=34480 RepID=A0ABR2VQL5_9FUNG
MKFALVTVALIACMTPAYQAAVSLDGRCGNGVDCPTGSCCSSWGFCGTGSAYCSASGGDGNANGNGNGNGNGGGSSDGTNNPSHDGQTPQNQPNPENSQPSPAPAQPGNDGNNAGSAPEQPVATTPVVSNPAATSTPDNNNKPNGGESLFNPLTVLSGVAIVLTGYWNH